MVTLYHCIKYHKPMQINILCIILTDECQVIFIYFIHITHYYSFINKRASKLGVLIIQYVSCKEFILVPMFHFIIQKFKKQTH